MGSHGFAFHGGYLRPGWRTRDPSDGRLNSLYIKRLRQKGVIMQSDNFERDHYVYASLEVLETLVLALAKSVSASDPELMPEIKRRLNNIRDDISNTPENRWEADQQVATQGALARIGARLDLGV